jgi:hypothetical protein
MKRALLIAGVVAAVAAAAAGAAAVGLVSQKISIFTKSLTRVTCTSATVSDDTYTDQFAPTSNFGTSTSLTASAKASKVQHAWIRFDLTPCSLPSGAEVDSATLTLVPTTASGRTIGAFRVTSTWSGSTLTWNTSPQPTVSASATASTAISTTAAKTWDVTLDAAAWVDGSATNFGWRMTDTGSSSNTGTTFSSSEAASNRPSLSITYVS